LQKDENKFLGKNGWEFKMLKINVLGYTRKQISFGGECNFFFLLHRGHGEGTEGHRVFFANLFIFKNDNLKIAKPLLSGCIIVPYFWGLNGVWLACPFADLLAFILTMLVLYYHYKKFNLLPLQSNTGKSQEK